MTVTARIDLRLRASQMGDAPEPGRCFLKGTQARLMLDQDQDPATVTGFTVPHWLLSAINGAAALILILVI